MLSSLFRSLILAGFCCCLATLTGCIHEPRMIPAEKQKIIDRKVVEYPSGFALMVVVDGLNCPTAMAVDDDGSVLIAESGIDGSEPHIFGYHRNGTYFNIYPYKRNISFYPGPSAFVMYGPIGGMLAHGGKIYVSHRDRDGTGIITALGYDGTHSTVKGHLPARGDYGVTDLAIGPNDGRLYFGVGTATNSGVVGVDNWDTGWLKRYPDVHDLPYAPSGTVQLLGRRFDTPNPRAGLFSTGDISVTAPFQQFGVSNQTRIPGSDMPNGAVFSVPLDGGTARVEAYGIHNPRGLGFDEYGNLYMLNDGMELRGTRPVKDDPDALVRVYPATWYGWPDYTTDLHPVSDPRYQPDPAMSIKSGYPDLSFLVDHESSGLHLVAGNAVAGVFLSQSGAAKFAIAPASGPLKEFAGNAIVALDGDRSPFSTSGVPNFKGPVGFKVQLVDRGTKQVKDFIANTAEVPASMQPFGVVALERPDDIKIGPDGTLYILDFGVMENKDGIPRYHNGTGRLFKMIPLAR